MTDPGCIDAETAMLETPQQSRGEARMLRVGSRRRGREIVDDRASRHVAKERPRRFPPGDDKLGTCEDGTAAHVAMAGMSRSLTRLANWATSSSITF